jgi:hypothetical protein
MMGMMIGFAHVEIIWFCTDVIEQSMKNPGPCKEVYGSLHMQIHPNTLTHTHTWWL